MQRKKRISDKKNKTISVTAKKISVMYVDTNKYYMYDIENQDPMRDVKLFGKKFKGASAHESKDYLTPKQRKILDDILYSKGKYTAEQITTLPLMRQYYILEVAAKVEKELYQWKKEIVSKQLDNFLLKLFPNSQLIKQLLKVTEGKTLYSDVNRIDIRNLVSEQQIVARLQQKGLFPKS